VAYRAIHDDVPQSDSLNRLSDFAERLYWRMLAVSDQCGRGPGSVTKIASLCVPRLPKSSDDVLSALEELVQARRIALYCENNVWAFQILEFDERQPVALTKGTRMSRFPAPPVAVRGGAHIAGAVPPADAVPLFDPDAVPEKVPHAVAGNEVADAVPQQVHSDSVHTEQRKEKERRDRPERATTRTPPGFAGLSDLSLEELGPELERRTGSLDGLGRLMAVLPDADRNTERVLAKLLEGLPEHAAHHARLELEAASSTVRSPTKYVVGILRNWNERGAAA
jgi:hypothetical protein